MRMNGLIKWVWLCAGSNADGGVEREGARLLDMEEGYCRYTVNIWPDRGVRWFEKGEVRASRRPGELCRECWGS